MKKEMTMIQLKFFPFATGLILFTSIAASADDVKVIANSSVSASAVSADDLKSAFLEDKTSLSGGSHVTPVQQKGGRLTRSL